LETTTAQGSPGEVYLFTTTQSPTSAPTQARTEDYEVWPKYLPALEGEKGLAVAPTLIKKAVENALSKQHAPKKGSVEYDSETRTLTVSGTRSDVQLAARVIEEMTRGRRIEAALEHLQSEVDALKAELARLKKSAPPPPVVN